MYKYNYHLSNNSQHPLSTCPRPLDGDKSKTHLFNDN